jgi:hypothetical protein
MVNTGNSYKIVVGKPEGKEPVRRPRSRWEDDIEIVLKGICLGVVGWNNLVHDKIEWRALVYMAMNHRVP